MSGVKHTLGRLYAANGNELHDKPCSFDTQGRRLGDTPNRVASIEYPYNDRTGQCANARRLAACWNACERFETEDIEGGAFQTSLVDPKIDYRAQRNALLAACKAMLEAYDGVTDYDGIEIPGAESALDAAEAAIAKAEGKP